MSGKPVTKYCKQDSDELTSDYFVKNRLGNEFFNVSCMDLAKNLLGTVLVRRLKDGTVLKGKIVETECYLGCEDKASHSYNGRRTARSEPMYMKPGTIYVYLTYGMYHCMNISSQGEGAAVLLRSIEPLIGLEKMSQYRSIYHIKRKSNCLKSQKTVEEFKSFKPHELCNGPSKLCISFDIDIENCNKQDITTFKNLWIEKRSEEIDESNIITSTRIGITSIGPEWANKPLRYYIYGNSSVSIKDKNQEKLQKEIRISKRNSH